MALNPSALFFNGTNQYAKMHAGASLRNLSSFTWMAWFKSYTGDSQIKRAFVERQGTGSGIRFAFTPYQGKLRFEFSPTDGVADTNYDYSYTYDDRWHHAAFIGRISGDNPTYEMFLDSNLVAQGALVRNAGVTNISDTAPLGNVYLANHSLHTSGGEVFPSDRYWNGKLDEVIAFNEAKNQQDIIAYFGSDDHWLLPDASVLYYFPLNDGTAEGVGTTESIDAVTGVKDVDFYEGGSFSDNIWTIDRPFLGQGTVDTTVPSTPTLPGTPTLGVWAHGFTADWNPSTDNVYVQFYELQVSEASDFSSYLSYNVGRIEHHDVLDLDPNTNYYWRVRAIDAENNASGYSTAQSLTTSGTGDLDPPLPPTSLVASQITHSSFRVSWTASASSDETGYKLDVATDPYFTEYLTDYRNRDVGNVLLFDVFGTQPLTTYYVRARAYDAAQNESAESTILVVQTTTVPDVTAPLVVDLLPPTSITSTAFTANWQEGIDDIGVAYYLFDLAYDSAFTQYVTIGVVQQAGINVGNVTSYRVEGVEDETGFYYRVRAVDGAGNISQNTTEGMPVQTLVRGVDEGGYLRTILNPFEDAYVDSTNATTNYGAVNPLQVQGSGAATTKEAYLLFDLSILAGTLHSVMLRLYVRDASGSITVAVDNVSFEEDTVTWNTKPTVGGSTLTFTPLTVDTWVSVDLTSLFVDATSVYTIKLSQTAADLFTFDSKEGTFAPELDVQTDPSTATEVETFEFHDHVAVRTNAVTNPSFEIGTTASWVAIGATPAVLTTPNVGANAYNGIYVCNVSCGGAATNQGARFANNVAVAAQNQWWSASISVLSISGSTNLLLRISEYSSGGTLLASSTVTFVANTLVWQRVYLERQLTEATTAFVTLSVETQAATASVFYIDAALLEGGVYRRGKGAYFDGDTSGAAYVGTVKASASTFGAGEFHADTTYIGDGDGDNSVVVYFKRRDQSEWITLPQLATALDHNRTTKRVSSLIGPSYGIYNYLQNPSFEVNTSLWTIYSTSGLMTFVRSTDDFFYGIASGLATLTGSRAQFEGVYSEYVSALAGETVQVRVKMKASQGLTMRLYITGVDSAGATTYTSTPTLLAGSVHVGSQTWVDMTDSATLPANTVRVAITTYADAPDAGWFRIDGAQIAKSSAQVPYLDGSLADGVWEGVANDSQTSYQLSPQTLYDIKHVYSDADGVTNDVNVDVFSLADSHTTTAVPDNVTTTGTLTLETTVDKVLYTATYEGDDNDTMTAVVEYRRTDLTNWATVVPTYNRLDRVVTGEITNLKNGTSYTVRVTFTDTNGVYGTNPLTSVATTSTLLGASEGSSMIMFGGFVLMGREDAKIGVISHDSFGLPTRRVQVESLPRVDGAIELQNLWGQRAISMQGFVEGESRAELEDNKNALKRALAPKLQQLVIDTLSNQGRFYHATCESLAISEVGGENIRHLTWDAEFMCADPFAYDASITVMPEFTAMSGSTVIAGNLGDLRIDPHIKIRTTHTSAITVTLTNNTTSERITPSVTIINGDRLVIDTEKLAVYKNGVEVDYAGGFPHLMPGNNQFAISLSAPVGTPSILIEFSWRHRYL
jgi:phage-related protein